MFPRETRAVEAHLELEELLELLLHLLGVRAAAPVAGQPVRVRHHLQQSQLRLKGHPRLCYERPAHRQNYAQRGRPPARTPFPFVVKAVKRNKVQNARKQDGHEERLKPRRHQRIPQRSVQERYMK